MNCFDIHNNFLTLNPYFSNVEEIIENLNKYISSYPCEKMSIDISCLNMIDAVKTGAICSTYHFSRYPFGALEWIVRDIETKNALKMLSLRTVKTSIKKPIIKNIYTSSHRKVIAFK